MKPVFKSLVVTSLLASAAFAAFAQAPTPAPTPTAEQRPLSFTGGTLVQNQLEGAWRRLTLKL